MSVFVKHADDGTQILEQILPYFQPEWTNSINLIPEMNLTYDVPCVLTDVSVEDTYEGSFDTRRALIWNLGFVMHGYIFGPTSTSGLIRRTNVDLSGALPDATGVERVSVYPGLTANGQPTSNANLSVSTSLIDSDDDYGFITSITEI